MKQSKHIQYSYLAGTVDSDGCIAIKKTMQATNNTGHSSYNLQILLNSPDGRQIDWLFGTFGGNIYKTFSQKGIVIWRWQINGEKAADLCKKMIPFLKYKKDQAQIGYQFQCLFNRQNKNLPYRREILMESELNQREKLYLKLRRLKKIFLKPRAAAETKRDRSSL